MKKQSDDIPCGCNHSMGDTEMAKKSTASDKLDALSKTLQKTEEAQQELLKKMSSDSEQMDATYRAVAPPAREERKASKLLSTVKEKNSKSHRVAVDLGGGMSAQVTTELLNLGVRALGRWSPDGWIGQNSDFLQGAPHFVLGLGVYIAEMASRKNMERPSTSREVISEASKLFSQLGFSNLVRALRVRYGDGKQKDLDMAALASEKVELEKRLRALQGGK